MERTAILSDLEALGRKPALFFLAVAVLLRWELLFGPYAPVQMFDTFDIFMTAMKSASAHLLQGGVYAWEHNTLCGHTVTAIGFNLFHPAVLLLTFMPLWLIYSLWTLLLNFFSSYGLYLYLSKIRRLTHAASLFGGFIFPFLNLGEAGNVSSAWIYLFPLYLYLFHNYHQVGRTKKLLYLLSMGAIFISSFLQLTLPFIPMIHFALILALSRPFQIMRRNLRLFFMLWGAYLLIQAPVIYSTFAEIPFSHRAEWIFDPPVGFMTYLIKIGTGNILSLDLFFNLIPLSLMITALWTARNRSVRFWTTTGAIVLLFVGLSHSRDGIAFIQHLGPIKLLQIVRFSILFPFIFCLLASEGFSALERERDAQTLFQKSFLFVVVVLIFLNARFLTSNTEYDQHRSVVFLGVVAALLAFLYSVIPPALKKFRLVALGLLSLYLIVTCNGIWQTRWAGTRFGYFFRNNPAAEFVKGALEKDVKNGSPYRVALMNSEYPVFLEYHGLQTADGYVNIYSARYKHFWAEVIKPIRMRSRAISSYFMTGGSRAYLWQILSSQEQIFDHLECNTHLLALANVKYLFSWYKIREPERYNLSLFYDPSTQPAENLHPLRMAKSDLRQLRWKGAFTNIREWLAGYRPYCVYVLNDALPRSFIVSDWLIQGQTMNTLNTLGRLTTRELSEKAVLQQQDIRGIQLPPPHPGPAGFSKITADKPDHIQVTGTSTRPGILVFSENYNEHWKASVNGRPQDVFPVDHTFIGTEVPAGSFTVELEYKDDLLHLMYFFELLGFPLLFAPIFLKQPAITEVTHETQRGAIRPRLLQQPL